MDNDRAFSTITIQILHAHVVLRDNAVCGRLRGSITSHKLSGLVQLTFTVKNTINLHVHQALLASGFRTGISLTSSTAWTSNCLV